MIEIAHWPTPNPSRKREGDRVAACSPLPLAGGAGGGSFADYNEGPK